MSILKIGYNGTFEEAKSMGQTGECWLSIHTMEKEDGRLWLTKKLIKKLLDLTSLPSLPAVSVMEKKNARFLQNKEWPKSPNSCFEGGFYIHKHAERS